MKWFWQAYCGLILFLGYGQLARKLLSDTGGFSSRYSGAIIVTILVVMLIAQSNGRAIAKKWVWQGLFVVLSATAGISFAFALYLGATGVWVSAGLLLVAALGMLPALLKLYQYSFKSPQLW